MKKGIALLCSLILVVCTMTACGSIPAMSETEEQMVSEYAAGLLLKYDSANHSRLVDTTEFMTAYENAEQVYETSKNAYYASIQKEEDKRRQETEAQEALNAENAANADNKSPYNADGDTNHSGGATVVDSRDISALFGLSDFSVAYAGYKLLDSYPEDGGDVYVSLVPTKGNSLLVVYFDCTNNSSLTQTLNIFDSTATFKLSLDSSKYSSVLPTYLDNVLSSYKGDFAPGETKTLVLITEVKKGTFVSSMGLRVSHNGDSITKILE